MATCGYCKATGQTVEHVRTCGQAGSAVATAERQLPTLALGNVVTLTSEEGYWLVEHVDEHNNGTRWIGVIQHQPNGKPVRSLTPDLADVQLVFANGHAAVDYDILTRSEATKARVRETLHGDADYCRGCVKGWAGEKWHRDGCPVIADRHAKAQAAAHEASQERQAYANHHDASGANLRDDNPWALVNALRNQVKAHLHRKVRNAQVGHFALRVDGVVKFYRVKLVTAGNWAGKVFVDAQASDEFYPVKTPATLTEVLTGILADPQAAERLYGTELGKCCRCNRTLTDETSRALGIGPECRSK